MDIQKIIEWEKNVYSQVFTRMPLALVQGDGMYLFDQEGNKYLDMFAGIAVNCLGHAHPRMVSAIKQQAEKLIHVSNWYYTLPQLELGDLLKQITGMDKVFYTNSGTEAVEAAIKLARSATGKKEIIAMQECFHGRTLGSLSITWKKDYKKPFKPLVPKTRFASYGDIESLKKQITEDTAAVILEPVLGEAGVILPQEGYLQEVREITQENNILLIVDEVQTGFGRTGQWFAYQKEDIEPDIICLAKAMGGGFPIGAMLSRGIDFKKGEHGGTYLGSPLACAVAKQVIETIQDEGLVENSKKQGIYLRKELQDMGYEARGMGLMNAFPTQDGPGMVKELIGKGVLSICSGNDLRLLPPLIIEKEHVDEFLGKLQAIHR